MKLKSWYTIHNGISTHRSKDSATLLLRNAHALHTQRHTRSDCMCFWLWWLRCECVSDGLVGCLAGTSVAVPTTTGSNAHKPLNLPLTQTHTHTHAPAWPSNHSILSKSDKHVHINIYAFLFCFTHPSPVLSAISCRYYVITHSVMHLFLIWGTHFQ